MRADEYYTLMLIPDARSASRKIRVSRRLVRWVVRTAAAASIAAIGLLAHYAWLNGQVSEVDALRVQNAELQQRAHEHRSTLDQLEGRIASLDRAVVRLGVISGVEQTLPEDRVTGGVGGVTGLDATPPSRDLDLVARSLSRSLSDLAARSTRIEGFYSDQKELLSHTPSIWPVRGYLSSGFCRRSDPFSGRMSRHSGIDVSAARGTKVVAPADGVVVAIGRRGPYGQSIIIDHGNDVITRYGHLDRYNVVAGQSVRRGDVIGFVGSTGRSNAPHLHYEVWVQDKVQNPIHYILEEYRSLG